MEAVGVGARELIWPFERLEVGSFEVGTGGELGIRSSRGKAGEERCG